MASDENEDDESQANPRWFEDLRPGAEGEGFLIKSLRHSLLFAQRKSDRLLVTFDNLSNVNNEDPAREPWAYKFAQDEGLAHLGVLAHVSDWYRDAGLMERFEKLVGEGFFEGYERVIFAGVSMGGYAALAYSSYVPGAHVITVNPQTTLDPALVPWETRYEKGQRQDWTLPMGDAAALTGSAGRVNVFYDPYHELDQKHVDRLAGDNISIFKCWFSQHKTAVFLRKIDALKPVMRHAIFDELTEEEFYRLYRARRNLPWYRGAVSNYFREKGREDLATHFDKSFRRRLRRKAKAEIGAEAEAPSEKAKPEITELPTEAKIPPGPKIAKKMKPPTHDCQIVAPANAGGKAPAKQGKGSRLIVTTMKNEGPFMLEWVAFNRSIGFTDFLIYTNDCDDGTDKIAQRLEELGLAQHRDNPFKKGGSPQRSALRAATKEEVYKNADWLICADCDEFLNVRVGKGRLDDLFAAVGEADGISVCWKLFGNSGRLEYEEGFVVEQFDRCCGEFEFPNFRAQGMKTLARNTERFERLKIHRPAYHVDRGDVAWVDGGGQPMPSAYLDGGWKAWDGFTHDLVRMHHYAVRSVDSFLVKRDRGRTNHVNDDQGVSYWENMNFNSTTDTSLHARLPGLRREFTKLMKDETLARLHAEACAWHRAKIEELKAREGWDEFRDKISRINAAPELIEG
ncbi:glycosyltransferase family 2 protein [Roseovarius sp. SCSIO 43702]|uniref:glycosyltransferase family 2 protein n=1 Tax=Roseovarius sp. SCSIO 43702 TaxID=2823043 RepID=UPI001C7386C2|nr:glycosyltransferase family 2 protein [Roseovarius sp. SCSIO 43702]QYX56863.1 glycosyltransferase family 2 protein [Roseovarius sp. SCSIO 43702]